MGFSTDTKQKLLKALHKGLEDKVFSGAAAFWSVDAELPCGVTAGKLASSSSCQVNENTLFDVASLTKLFTTALVCRLIDRGALSLSTRLGELGDSAAMSEGMASLTIEDVLAHESGLVAWRPFYETVPMYIRHSEAGKHLILSRILEETPDTGRRGECVYSDLGFISLGFLLEVLTRKGLAELVREEIVIPLGLKDTGYIDDPVFADSTGGNFVATADCPWRGRFIQGEVHDDNAWAMGGIAGHAGIFSTAFDIAEFGRRWMLALDGSDDWISPEIAGLLVRRRDSGRGLGFDLKTGMTSAAGVGASDRTFGHLGFTGTSLWIDPEQHAVVALLTNRVHCSSEPDMIRSFRPHFHDIFWECVKEGRK